MCFLGNKKRTLKFNLQCIEFRNFRAAAAKCGGPLTSFEETAYPVKHLAEYVGSQLRSLQYWLFISIAFNFTYSMVQSLSWEANWFAASQEIPRISRKPKVHYRTHKSIYPHPTSWRSHPYAPMPSPSHSSRFYHPHNIGWGVQII